MSVGSESIFHGKQFIIPLDEVAFIEIGPHEICVVMKGYHHPTCPYLSGEEKDAFLRTFQAWCSHRVKRDGVANAVVPIAKVEGLPPHVTCPECKGKQYRTVLTPESNMAPAEQVECERCGGDGYLPVFTLEQVEESVSLALATYRFGAEYSIPLDEQDRFLRVVSTRLREGGAHKG